MVALDAIEFTVCPPLTTPTLNVVRGVAGTCSAPIFAIARPRACTGLGMPKAP
jgi:hypothetical protein